MKKIVLLFCLIAFCAFSIFAQRKPIGNLLTENIPDMSPSLVERWDQYQNIRAASFADWDANGGMYVVTRFADVAQVHHVKSAGAYREQITFSKEPITGAKVSPNTANNGFLFSKDKGGDENFQIYFFDRKTGKNKLITDGKSRNGNAIWNKKGDKIAFSSNKRDGKNIDFYITDFNASENVQLLLQNTGGGWNMVDWSDDDSKMIIQNSISANESKLYIYDLTIKKLDEIHPTTKQIAYRDASFADNNRDIWFVNDEAGEYNALYYYSASMKEATKIVSPEGEIESLVFSHNRKQFVYVVNEKGYSTAYLYDTQNVVSAKLQTPQGVVGNLNFDTKDERIAISIVTPTSPSDVYVYDIKNKTSERWTFSETGGLNPDNFVTCSLINFPTFDTDEATHKTRIIPSFMFKPKNATSAKLPVIIDIHGGPEGQSLPNFSNSRQFWANELGCVVLVPNVRGSTGYGKTYLKLDNGALRENSVKDIGALLDWVATQPDLDASRVAVFGGSYGGYMSLACMTNFNARLRCGVDLFGISNFVTFLKNTSSYRADLRRVEYGDERDPAMAQILERISPLTNIKNITKPMFIFQGENDPRVPLNESEQMLASLKTNGVTTWYVRAKDEGHGIAKKANRDYTYAAIAAFLQKFLVEN
mgnify:CR=1 FL=1